MTIPLQTITSLRTTFNPFARSSRPCRLLLSLLRNPSTRPPAAPHTSTSKPRSCRGPRRSSPS
ncbi:hypothetical protein AOCH_004653 [Aspergillus ochraceoroseus]|uniref:Uncharacterized protein n=1 Tax=Aspergillus ochraceoroseus TaxID=138278 RepID=A0A0F8UVM8_9EURO|nr:hypothetical protein AOCH_004653 [Aspergillus ochraceoroseus]